MERSREKSRFLDAGWPAYLACVLAFTGLAVSVFYKFNPHLSQNAASDFKTLYASTWCFVHGLDAYQFPNLARVFALNGVVEPQSWYGHSPVYPPFTLALLAPLTLLPMVPAIYAWISLGTVCAAMATGALLHAAGRLFGLQLPSRLLLVAAVAASPLLEIGLELANVSVVAASLCVCAVAAPRSINPWLRAAALVIALLLKPHIAFWVCIAFLFSRSVHDRKAIWYTGALAVVALAVFGVWGVADHSVLLQFSSYRRIVLSELGSGSMSPGNRDVMEVFVQITSLSSLLGYWLWQRIGFSLVTGVILLSVAGALAWTCWRSRDADPSQLLRNAAAWSAFGLLATYHRDADALVLILLLPLLFSRLKSNFNDMWAWCVLAAIAAGWLGPSADSLHRFTDPAQPGSLVRFALLRQASLSAASLTALLLGGRIVALPSTKRPSH